VRQCAWQCATVRLAVCGSALGSVRLSGRVAVSGRAAVCGSEAVCGSVAVCDSAAVCDSVSGSSVWQYARGNVQQCGSV
jgi:hypothetical protein